MGTEERFITAIDETTLTLDKPLADFEEPRGLPTTWLIDPQGKVAAHIVGPVTTASLAKAIGVE